MTAIIQDQETKQELVTALAETARLAEEIGMATLAHDLTGTRLPKLEEERFHLVVLGEFNHGKSTFVNALLDTPVLPAGITPTTATINHLVWSEQPRARAHLVDGGTIDINPYQLGDWVTIEGKETGRVKYVEVGWPAEILRDRLTLVDTPGVNDINEQRAEITYGYIPRADACLFLLDGAQVLKQSERAFLEQRILRRSRDKLVFVIGKMDLLTPEERDEALAFCRSHLEKIVPDPAIYTISAKRWLKGDREGSGMQALLDYLGRFLANERGRVLLDNAIGDGLRTLAYLGQNLGIKRRSLALNLEELEARIAKVRVELDTRRATLRTIHEKIRAESQAIQANVRLDLEEFAEAFVRAVPGEIDRAQAEDVRRYFQFFLQDTWKEWAEQEGDKVAGQLERLAEEIIQITNENVHETTATLARELGPAETHITLEVDTLKYDVGVFAVGALGAGIAFFVNALVGGALTLVAAPLLAYVLRGRAAEQVKHEAKEQAPKVICQAADVVRPRFEKIVEDFTQRLSDFVTAAGDALHAGISEVLDRALAERRAQGIDATARESEMAAQEQRLRALEQRLAALRDRLWAKAAVEAEAEVEQV
jgi:small GTP-binding protein